MYRRRLRQALDHRDVQELVAAELFAEQRGKKLNTVITIHPKLIDEQPADIGLWVSWLTNKVRIFCERDRKFGYFAFWIRESYDGKDREHLHIVMYVPKRHKADLEGSLRRWLTGDPRAIKLTEPEYDHKQRDRFDRPVNKALTYLLKQMTTQARFALKAQGLNVRRECHCRKTHSPVAAVLGRRAGVSRSLNARARRALSQPHTTVPATRQTSFLKTATGD